jgi:hypothetical protein
VLRRQGLAFAHLLRAAWVEYERDHARYLAVAMVYYAIVSLVPLVLLLLAALGLLLRFSATAAEARWQTLAGHRGALRARAVDDDHRAPPGRLGRTARPRQGRSGVTRSPMVSLVTPRPGRQVHP